MTSQPYLTLYHTTNRVSAETMLKTGMGLDLNDYEQMYLKLKQYLNVPIDALADLFTNQHPEHEGAVWFYTSQELALKNIQLAAQGGVFRRTFVKGLISRSARHHNVPYTQLQDAEEKLLGSLSEPVIVMANISPSMLVEPSKIGASSEFRTFNKVPSSHIQKIISCL